MSEANKITSGVSISSSNLLENVQHDRINNKLDMWDREYLYVLLTGNVKAENLDAVYSYTKKVLSGEKELIISSKAPEDLSAGELDSISAEEIQLYVTIYNMFLFIDPINYAIPLNVGADKTENKRNLLLAVKKQLGIFSADKLVTEALIDALKMASWRAKASGITSTKEEKNINVYYEPYIRLVAFKVWEDFRGDREASGDRFITARNKVISSMSDLRVFTPKVPGNDEDRFVLQIYAELFTQAGYAPEGVKWQDLNDADLCGFVSERIAEFSKSKNMSGISLRYLIYQGLKQPGVEMRVKISAGKINLLDDCIGNKNPTDATRILLNSRMSDITGGTTETIYLSFDNEKDKVRESVIQSIVEGNPAYVALENDVLGRALAYAISYIYGFTREESIDINAFTNFLYQFCKDNGMGGNLEGCNKEIDGKTYNVSMKINRELLERLCAEYFVKVKGSQRQFKLGNNMGTENKFKDTARIAESAPIIAMKCLLLTRGLPYSQIIYEMLTAEDVTGIMKVFGSIEGRGGLSKNDIDILKKFAEKLAAGDYSDIPGVISIMGRDKMQYAITSFTTTGKDEDYDKAMKVLNRIAFQLSEITPQEETRFYDVFKAAAAEAKMKVKLQGVDLQVTLALKSRFYREELKTLKARFKEVGLKGLTETEKKRLIYFTSDTVDIDLWTKLKEQFPEYFKTLAGTARELQLDIEFPCEVIKGKMANNEVEFINIVIENEKELRTLKMEPGEQRTVSMAKKMLSYTLVGLGAYSIRTRNWLADAFAVVPAEGVVANVALKGIATVFDQTFDTSKIIGTVFEGLGTPSTWHVEDLWGFEKPINTMIKTLDQSAQNPSNTKNNFAPYIYMFIANTDKESALKMIMDMLYTEGETGEAADPVRQLSTLTTGNITKTIKLLENLQESINRIIKVNPNIVSLMLNDEAIKKAISAGLIEIKDNKISITYSRLSAFRDKVKSQYGGSFGELYYERIAIPANIRNEGADFVTSIIATFKMLNIVSSQPGIISMKAPITADDIEKGWKAANRNTPGNKGLFDTAWGWVSGNKGLLDNKSFFRFSEQVDNNAVIRKAAMAGEAMPLDRVPAPLRSLVNITGASMETSFQLITARIYFARTYVNIVDMAIDGFEDHEKWGEALKQLGKLSVQMANFGFNPAALFDYDHCMDLYRKGRYEELAGYLMVISGYAVYVLQRDALLVSSVLRSFAGKSRIEMQYGILEKPVELAERGLEKLIDLRSLEARQQGGFGRFAGKADEKLQRVMEKVSGVGTKFEWLTQNRPWDWAVKKFYWQGFVKLNWAHYLMDKAGGKIGKRFDLAWAKLSREKGNVREFMARAQALQAQMYGEALAQLTPDELTEFDRLVSSEFVRAVKATKGAKLPPTFSFTREGEQACFSISPDKKGYKVELAYGNPLAMYQMSRVQGILDSLPKDAGGLPSMEINGQIVPVMEVAFTSGDGMAFDVFNYEGRIGVKVSLGVELLSKGTSGQFVEIFRKAAEKMKGFTPAAEELEPKEKVEAAFAANEGGSTLTLDEISIAGRSVDATVERVNALEGFMRERTWQELTDLSAELESQSASAFSGVEDVKERLAIIEGTEFRGGPNKGMTLLEVRLAQTKELYRRLTAKDITVGNGAGQISAEVRKMAVANPRYINDESLPAGKNAMSAQLQAAIVMQHDLTSIQANPGEGKTVDGALFNSVVKLTGKKIYSTTHDIGAAWQLFNDVELVDKVLKINTVFIDTSTDSPETIREAFLRGDKIIITQGELNFQILNNRAVVMTSDRIPIDFNGVLLLDELDFMILDQGQTPHILSAPNMGEVTDAALWRRAWGQVNGRINKMGIKIGGLNKDDFLPNGELSPNGLKNLNWAKLSLEQRHRINMCLQAKFSLREGVDYEVRKFKDTIYLIDRSTGRVLKGHELSDGLHQALQAKHGVKITQPMSSLESGTMSECLEMFANKLGMSATLDKIKTVLDVKGIRYLKLDTNIPQYTVTYDPAISDGKNIEANLEAARARLNRSAKLGVTFGENKLQIFFDAGDPKATELAGRIIDQLNTETSPENGKRISCTRVMTYKEQIFASRKAEVARLVEDMAARLKAAGGKQKGMKPTLVNVQDPEFAVELGKRLKKEGYSVTVITHKNEADLRTICKNGMRNGDLVITTLARRAIDIPIKSKEGGLQYIVDRGSTRATLGQQIGRIPRFGANGEIVQFTSFDDPVWRVPVEKEELRGILERTGFKDVAALTKEFMGSEGSITYADIARKAAAENLSVEGILEMAQTANDNRAFINEYVASKMNMEFSRKTSSLYKDLTAMQEATDPRAVIKMALESEIDYLMEKHGIKPNKPVTPAQLAALEKDLIAINKDGITFKIDRGVKYTGADIRESIIKAYETHYFSRVRGFLSGVTGSSSNWKDAVLEQFNAMRRSAEQLQQEIIKTYNSGNYRGGQSFKVNPDGSVKATKPVEALVDSVVSRFGDRVVESSHRANVGILRGFQKWNFLVKSIGTIELHKGGESVPVTIPEETAKPEAKGKTEPTPKAEEAKPAPETEPKAAAGSPSVEEVKLRKAGSLNEEVANIPADQKVATPTKDKIKKALSGSTACMIVLQGMIIYQGIKGTKTVWDPKHPGDFLWEMTKGIASGEAGLAIFTMTDKGLTLIKGAAGKMLLENAMKRMTIAGALIGAGEGLYQNWDQLGDEDRAERIAARLNTLNSVVTGMGGAFGYAAGAAATEAGVLATGSTLLTTEVAGALVLTATGTVVVFLGGVAVGAIAVGALSIGKNIIWENSEYQESDFAHELEKASGGILEVKSGKVTEQLRADMMDPQKIAFLRTILELKGEREKLSKAFSKITFDSPYMVSQELLDYLVKYAESHFKGKVEVNVSFARNNEGFVELSQERNISHPRYVVTFKTHDGRESALNVTDFTISIKSIEKKVVTSAVRAAMFATAKGQGNYVTSFMLENMNVDSVEFRDGMADISQHVYYVMKKMIDVGYIKVPEDEWGRKLTAAINDSPNAFEAFIFRGIGDPNKEKIHAMFVAGVSAFRAAHKGKKGVFGPSDVRDLEAEWGKHAAEETAKNYERVAALIHKAKAEGRRTITALPGEKAEDVFDRAYKSWWPTDVKQKVQRYVEVRRNFHEIMARLNGIKPGESITTQMLLVLPNAGDEKTILRASGPTPFF